MAGTSTTFVEVLPPDVRRFVEARMKPMRVRKGQAVVSRGNPTSDVYFVLEGAFGVVLYSVHGREVVLRILGPGEIFGELAALDGAARVATVLAESDGRVAALPRGDFLACLEASPAAALWVARLLVTQIRNMTDKVFELSALNVQSRLHCELLRLARNAGIHDGQAVLSPAPTHAEIASRIGTHREAVTRELQALASAQIVRHSRRTLEILDVAGLERTILRAGSSPA